MTRRLHSTELLVVTVLLAVFPLLCGGARTANFTLQPTANYFNNPTGVAVDLMRQYLYVADTGNNRVLQFTGIYQPTFTSVSFPPGIFGQLGPAAANLPNQNMSTPTLSTLNGPRGIDVNSSTGDFYVADNGNNRVLWYGVSTIPGGPAIGVLGQSTGTTNSSSTTASTLAGPSGVFVHGSSLWVADTNNNR